MDRTFKAHFILVVRRGQPLVFPGLKDATSRYWEKPYYLVPDGDEADEGYAIMRRALADTGKVAIGQLIMHGRQHLVGIKALEGGLVLSILRYADELRDFTPYFEGINTKAEQKS